MTNADFAALAALFAERDTSQKQLEGLMTPADFAAFVALCKERGMSQKQLAVILGIDAGRVTAYQSKLPARVVHSSVISYAFLACLGA